MCLVVRTVYIVNNPKSFRDSEATALRKLYLQHMSLK